MRHTYELIVRGRVGDTVSHALDDFELVSSSTDQTRFVGFVQDQSALQGLLQRLASYGLQIVSFGPVDDDDDDDGGDDSH